MPKPLLLDTDVLVDYLRGHEAAVEFVENNAEHIVVSAMSVAELYAGVRGEVGDPEHAALANFVDLFSIIPITADIARSGGLYRRNYGKSHGVGLAVAVIAATVDSSHAALRTLNVKHYPMFRRLKPAYRK